METYKIHSLLRSLLSDVCEMFPAFLDEKKECDQLDQLLAKYGELDLVSLFSSLGKALEKSLITLKRMNYGVLEVVDDYPTFLRELWVIVFFADGLPRDVCDEPTSMRTSAVFALRQFLLVFSKLTDIECQASENEEIRSFVERISAVPEVQLAATTLGCARRLLAMLYEQSSASFAQFDDSPFGLHGPGAVFNREKGSEKWNFSFLPGSPNGLFSFYKSYMSEEQIVPRVNRLAIVPKDFRKHRLICVEQKEMMFFQQGLARVISQALERFAPSRCCINLNDQQPSFRASRNKDIATIDLSDASDLLSTRLAKLLLPAELWRRLSQARSCFTELPDGSYCRISGTLFTMGNALCFPVETMIFWSLAAASILEQYGLDRVSDMLVITKALKVAKLRVFGDDIIVHDSLVDDVIASLRDAGLRVNEEKTCKGLSSVREACGSWWYNSVDCSIVRLKYHEANNDSSWMAMLASAKLLYQSGFVRTAIDMLTTLNDYYPVPWGCGWIPQLLTPKRRRYNKDLQRSEFLIPVEVAQPSRLTGEVGLYSYFTGKSSAMAPLHGTVAEKRWVDVI